MKITKKINNNVALAQDGDGRELIVFGKGVGFPPAPYELTDLSVVQRTFYDVRSNYTELIESLPDEIVLLSSDIVEFAKCELRCELNPNVPFTLADHLNFAIERAKKGVALETPLAYDVEHLYPKEVQVAGRALKILEDRIKIRLPDSEKISIALHLINAEVETGDMHITMLATTIIRDVTDIVEHSLQVCLDKTSFSYSRFTMHLRYLISRIMNGEQEEEPSGNMLTQFRKEYCDIYACVQKIVQYFSTRWKWECNENEIFYLFIHIHRVKESGNLQK